MSLTNIVVDTTRSFPAGVFQSQTFNIPQGWKKAGSALRIMLEMQAEDFPAGTTTVEVWFSTDTGATFTGASMTCVNPATWKGAPPHFWTLTYELGVDGLPNRAFYKTDAPAAFSTRVIVSIG